MFEAAIAAAADEHPGVTVRRGVRVIGPDRPAGVEEKIDRLRDVEAQPPPGPDREQLLQLLAA